MIRKLLVVALLPFLVISAAAQEPFEGETLISPMNMTTSVLIDIDGVSLMTWHGAARPASMAYLLDDGSILRPSVHPGGAFSGGGTGGRIERIDAQDTVVWSYLFATQEHQQHHDIEPLPNGNVLLVAWELKSRNEAIAAGRQSISGEMWPTLLVEVEPDGASGGTIVWEWHAWDHLVQDADPTKPGFGVIADHPELLDINYGSLQPGSGDWLHINSIDYDPTFDQIIICSRPFGEFHVIDHSTTTEEAAGHTGGLSGMGGDILYRWGNPQTYDRGTAGDQYLFAPHGVVWIEPGLPGEGSILVFNNGDRPGSINDYSTVDEILPPRNPDGTFAITAGFPFGPAAPSWTYGGPGGDYGGPTQCGAYRMPNGNTLVCYSIDGYLFEVDEAGVLVWDYQQPGGSRVARAERYWDEPTAVDAGQPVAVADRLRLVAIDASPCTRSTAIGFDLPADADVRLAIYDIHGRLVRRLVDGSLRAGGHSARWNGRDAAGRALAHGVYFVRLDAAGASATTRLVLVR